MLTSRLLRSTKPWWYVHEIQAEPDGLIASMMPPSVRRYLPAEQWGPPLMLVHLVHPKVPALPIGITTFEDALNNRPHLRGYLETKPIREGDLVQDNGRPKGWRPYGTVESVKGSQCLLDFADALPDGHDRKVWRSQDSIITGVGVCSVHLGVPVTWPDVLSSLQRCWPFHAGAVSITAPGFGSTGDFFRTPNISSKTLLSEMAAEGFHLEKGHLPQQPHDKEEVCKSICSITVDGAETPVFFRAEDAKALPGSAGFLGSLFARR